MIPLPMKPGEMPQAPSREQVEEQSVRWAYLARQAMQRNDTKVAEQLGSVLQTALEGYYKMYGPEAGDQLRRAMAAAGVMAPGLGMKVACFDSRGGVHVSAGSAPPAG
jgi:hypothetical protein